jgi:hypothetical protein
MFWCASFRLRTVSVTGFQLMRSPGSLEGDAGTHCAVRRPTAATARQAMAT